MEQFNPGLRNLINLGKNYEKAVNGKSSRCKLKKECLILIYILDMSVVYKLNFQVEL